MLWLVAGLVCVAASAQGEEPSREVIRLANSPALSPDGKTLLFAWGGEVWSVDSGGGRARPLTRNPANDSDPEFSPDGRQIAFVSDRQGAPHVYVMSADGGAPRQVGFHSEGYKIDAWGGPANALLVSARRDHHWRDSERFFFLRPDERTAETPVFDSAGTDGALSPDGKRILFIRGGAQWWRKGYKGSGASQLWLYDIEKAEYTKLLDPPTGVRSPLWKPDGKGFYYVGVHNGAFNLIERDLDTGNETPLTRFDDDSVVQPCIAKDGSTIVFRHLFDLYRLKPADKAPATKIEIVNDGDTPRDPIERRTLSQATQVAFSRDGLEVAFIAGGDLWVMDTELKEPRQITATPEEERDPVFSPKGDAILFVSDQGGQTDVWKAERADATLDWWQNTAFKRDRLSNDGEVESDLQWSPEGSKVAYLKVRGDLWVMDADGQNARRVIASWNEPRYDWSPDGKWLVYAAADSDFNQDVWITPVDGSRPPFNVSRHPDNEDDPVWSPDGKIIAFTGRRQAEEIDIYFVWLQEEDDEKSSRERTLEKAIEKMKQRRKGAAAEGSKEKKDGDKAEGGEKEKDKDRKDAKKSPPNVVIDFDRIHERIRRVSIPDSTENRLFWSPDSKKLAFNGSHEGKSGVFTIEFPSDLTPKSLTTESGSQARWIETGNQIVWLAGGVPASFTPGGKTSTYNFRALQLVNLGEKYRAAFDQCWRIMRDRWYDERIGNRNWDAVRRKYLDIAGQAPDTDTLTTVVNLMLGEINGSHLGFSTGAAAAAPGPRRRGPGGGAGAAGGSDRWNVTTAHLGLRFDPKFKGPGIKVRDVLPESPADHKATRITPGEVVLSIDGTPVDPGFDLTKLLNGPLDRDVKLVVRNGEGKDRTVVLRPIPYATAREQLYEKWVKDNRRAVDEGSKGALGYLHIRGMDMPSFFRFEEELYSAAAGKAGLVVDVRENGGGSTADHLLTILTQPHHAITVPRGGEPGYPQDRRIYAVWQKPIVVLCNQNSFSNAEIFSHAIKTLKRGKLVGVPTAGGVVSTGAASIMDIGTLRLPTRGWFVRDTGEDMELNGAVPDVILWPDPADFARGVDAQLAKGVEVLLADVKAEAEKPKPKLRKATER